MLAELALREGGAFFEDFLSLELVLSVTVTPSSPLSEDFDFRRNILPIERGFFARRSDKDLKRLCGVAMI